MTRNRRLRANTSPRHTRGPAPNAINLQIHLHHIISIDYIMAEVVLYRPAYKPNLVVFSLGSWVLYRTRYDTRPMTRGRIQLGRADVRNDTTSAMLSSIMIHLSFIFHVK